MKKRKLALIDGHAIIHRAFHAIPELTTREGELVNSVYGFCLILLNVLKEVKPTHIAVALDVGGKTIRHKEYKLYKAHRVKAPDELHNQVPRIIEVLKAFNIPVFMKKGYEADDLIGTLANQAGRLNNVETVIVTGDLDTLQLINPKVKIYTMKRGLTDTIVYDEQLFKERFSFPPSNLIDYKGLRGDPSDNIPGVKGIGEKTAKELVKKYGTIENIYADLDKIDFSDRYKKLLHEERDEAFLSKKLATIMIDLPISLDMEKSKLHDYDRTKVLKIFQELGFKSLITKLPSRNNESTSRQETLFVENKTKKIKIKKGYSIIRNIVEAERLIKEIKQKKIFAVDVETNVLGGELIGISFSLREKEAFYLPLTGDDKSSYLELIKPVLTNERLRKIGHNLKYDYLIFLKKGIKMDGIVFDTMLAAYILNPGKRNYDLDNLSFIELGYEKITIESLIGVGKKQKSLLDVPLKNIAQYSCEDADMTFRLYKLLDKRLLSKLREVYFKIELPLINVLAKMEKMGIKVDEAKLKKMSQDFAHRIETLRQKIYKISGSKFNINSTQQLREVLFDKLKIDTIDVRKTKTGLSTAAAELEKLKERHEIIDLIFRYREINKLKNTYLDALPRLVGREGRIHTSFNQTITTTGRLSSSAPNLQNIPVRSDLGNRIRQAFIAKSGYTLLAFDYSQIELRVVAHLAEDKKMISAFKKNEDIHAATASWLFHKPIQKISSEERRKAKTVNFGVLYGMSSYGLSQGMGVDRDYAAEFIENYFNTFSGLRNYLSETKDFARKYGYVRTLTGRRRYIPEINSAVFEIASGAERMAINMPVQGTAADIIKIAMIEIQDKIIDQYTDIDLLLQVHDELVFEVKKDKIGFFASKIKKIMEEAFKLTVPIKVDVSRGTSWGALKKFD